MATYVSRKVPMYRDVSRALSFARCSGHSKSNVFPNSTKYCVRVVRVDNKSLSIGSAVSVKASSH